MQGEGGGNQYSVLALNLLGQSKGMSLRGCVEGGGAFLSFISFADKSLTSFAGLYQ